MSGNNGYIRLKKVIKWSGLNTHAFALRIGMNRAENLYRIIRSKGNVSIYVAKIIAKAYPNISMSWLLYGIGKMIITEECVFENYESIPVYGTNRTSPLYYINIPIFKDAEFAIMYSDKSMKSLIPSNSTIILNTQVDAITYGQLYYVETAMFSVARIIRKSEISDDEVILVAINKHYNNIVLAKKDIVSYHLICGIITAFVNFQQP